MLIFFIYWQRDSLSFSLYKICWKLKTYDNRKKSKKLKVLIFWKKVTSHWVLLKIIFKNKTSHLLVSRNMTKRLNQEQQRGFVLFTSHTRMTKMMGREKGGGDWDIICLIWSEQVFPLERTRTRQPAWHVQLVDTGKTLKVTTVGLVFFLHSTQVMFNCCSERGGGGLVIFFFFLER